MKINYLLVSIGFAICISAAILNLPAEDTLKIINPDNAFVFLTKFFFDFLKTPISWAGIVLIILGYRNSDKRLESIKKSKPANKATNKEERLQ